MNANLNISSYNVTGPNRVNYQAMYNKMGIPYKGYVIEMLLSHSKIKGYGKAILCDQFKKPKYKDNDVVILSAVGGTGHGIQKIFKMPNSEVEKITGTTSLNNLRKFVNKYKIQNIKNEKPIINRNKSELLFLVKKVLTTSKLVKYYQSIGFHKVNSNLVGWSIPMKTTVGEIRSKCQPFKLPTNNVEFKKFLNSKNLSVANQEAIQQRIKIFKRPANVSRVKTRLNKLIKSQPSLQNNLLKFFVK